jgi:hypothetical protein
MEIVNSKTWRAAKAGWGMVLLVFAGGGMLLAGETNRSVFVARAGADFHRAQTQFQSDTNDPAAAWQFARACFGVADFATNDTDRATLAIQGIAACRQLLVQHPKSAPGHYYLGMNLGQLARTEILGALKLVKQMEVEFKTADTLDEHFDYAGPARCLGLLYRDAPGWPTSIGSRHKAHEWLERAVKLAPNYPENQLHLIESRLQWNDRTAAETEFKTLEALWPSAQTNFTGEVWEQNWDDWSTRRNAVREKHNETSNSKKTPKNASN